MLTSGYYNCYQLFYFVNCAFNFSNFAMRTHMVKSLRKKHIFKTSAPYNQTFSNVFNLGV